MPYNVTVIGMGYVGLTSAVGLADFGNNVTGVDIDCTKVEQLNKGKTTIFEIGLEDYLSRNLHAGRLCFTSDIRKAILSAQLIFIAAGTPVKSDGEPDLSQIHDIVNQIEIKSNDYKVIITKSTVPIGTNRWILEKVRQRTGHDNFGVISNPEFLREGRAIHDFFHPDRVVVGFISEKAREYIADIYRPLYLIQTPFVWCSLETAELVKYASNAFLALKISFINQMANLAETVGADIHDVARAIGMDGRINPKFLHPGPGFGGSCLPKDARALAFLGDKVNVNLSLIKEIIKTNILQNERMIEKLKKLTEIKGKEITVLGLAFKSETEDVRESPALRIVERLIKEGANVRAHDPKAINNFREIFREVAYYSNLYDAAEGADAIMILTEWNEYRNINLLKLKSLMKSAVILDTRNVLDPETVRNLGFKYGCVGR